MSKIKRKTKVCRTCGKRKSIDKFYRKNDNQDGHQSYCKSCCNSIRNERKRKVKEEMVKYLGGRCMICGYDECIAALECHHRDSSQKEYQPSDLRNLKEETWKKELDKCDLLCANCHRELHWQENNGGQDE